MKVTNLNELFVHELKDLYDAEHQLVEALPKMAEAASNPELTEAFENHLVQTRSHVTRLEAVFRTCGEEPERETCKGMKGLIAEGEKAIKEIDDPDTRDAALISAAQRVEHYEIAGYGTVRTYAQLLKDDESARLLQQTLDEEGQTDKLLTQLAESQINVEAA